MGAGGVSGSSSGGGRLLSLDTLLEQERRYTDILASKVLALEPDVVFLSQSASRLALELLRIGRVSVVTHVKPSVMQRLSRLCGGRIVPSINYLDKLPRSELIGTAARRFQVRTMQVPLPPPPTNARPLFSPQAAATAAAWLEAQPGLPLASGPGRPVAAGSTSSYAAADASSASTSSPAAVSRVSYVSVWGGPEHRGCAVLLRGERKDAQAAKKIFRYTLYVARQLRLQTAFLFDSCMGWSATGIGSAADGSALRQVQQLVSLLSSPAATSLLTRHQRSVILNWHLSLQSAPSLSALMALQRLLAPHKVIDSSSVPSSKLLLEDGSHSTNVQRSFSSSSIGGAAASALGGAPSVSTSSSDTSSSLPALLRSADLTLARSATDSDPLASASQLENVVVATYALSSDNANPAQCGARPRLRCIRFCAPSDRTLGQFLEERCLDERAVCRSCHRGPTAHTLCYLHGSARLDITVVRANPGTVAMLAQQVAAGGAAAVLPAAMAPLAPSAELHTSLVSKADATTGGAVTFSSSSSSAGAIGSSGTPLAHSAVTITTSSAPLVVGHTKLPLPAPHTQPQSSASSSSSSGGSGGGGGISSDIVTWSYCPACKRFVAPVTRLSRNAWTLSFGKLLQLSFYSDGAGDAVGDVNSGGNGCAGPRAGDKSCPHSPFLSHIRYFARGKLVAVFRMAPLCPLTIFTPSSFVVPSMRFPAAYQPLSLAPAGQSHKSGSASGTFWYKRLLHRELEDTELAAGHQARVLTDTIQRLQRIITAAEEVASAVVALRGSAASAPTASAAVAGPSFASPKSSVGSPFPSSSLDFSSPPGGGRTHSDEAPDGSRARQLAALLTSPSAGEHGQQQLKQPSLSSSSSTGLLKRLESPAMTRQSSVGSRSTTSLTAAATAEGLLDDDDNDDGDDDAAAGGEEGGDIDVEEGVATPVAKDGGSTPVHSRAIGPISSASSSAASKRSSIGKATPQVPLSPPAAAPAPAPSTALRPRSRSFAGMLLSSPPSSTSASDAVSAAIGSPGVMLGSPPPPGASSSSQRRSTVQQQSTQAKRYAIRSSTKRTIGTGGDFTASGSGASSGLSTPVVTGGEAGAASITVGLSAPAQGLLSPALSATSSSSSSIVSSLNAMLPPRDYLRRLKGSLEVLSNNLGSSYDELRAGLSALRAALSAGERVDMLLAVAPRRTWLLRLRGFQDRLIPLPASITRASERIAAVVSNYLASYTAASSFAAQPPPSVSNEGMGTAVAGGVVKPPSISSSSSLPSSLPVELESYADGVPAVPSATVGSGPSLSGSSNASNGSTSGAIQAGNSAVTALRLQLSELEAAPSLTDILTPAEPAASGEGSNSSSSSAASSSPLLSMFIGHLSLPVGLQGSVVPVVDGVASTIIAYSLASELYWRKLEETVDTAWERWHEGATTTEAEEESDGEGLALTSDGEGAADSSFVQSSSPRGPQPGASPPSPYRTLLGALTSAASGAPAPPSPTLGPAGAGAALPMARPLSSGNLAGLTQPQVQPAAAAGRGGIVDGADEDDEDDDYAAEDEDEGEVDADDAEGDEDNDEDEEVEEAVADDALVTGAGSVATLADEPADEDDDAGADDEGGDGDDLVGEDVDAIVPGEGEQSPLPRSSITDSVAASDADLDGPHSVDVSKAAAVNSDVSSAVLLRPVLQPGVVTGKAASPSHTLARMGKPVSPPRHSPTLSRHYSAAKAASPGSGAAASSFFGLRKEAAVTAAVVSGTSNGSLVGGSSSSTSSSGGKKKANASASGRGSGGGRAAASQQRHATAQARAHITFTSSISPPLGAASQSNLLAGRPGSSGRLLLQNASSSSGSPGSPSKAQQLLRQQQSPIGSRPTSSRAMSLASAQKQSPLLARASSVMGAGGAFALTSSQEMKPLTSPPRPAVGQDAPLIPSEGASSSPPPKLKSLVAAIVSPGGDNAAASQRHKRGAIGHNTHHQQHHHRSVTPPVVNPSSAAASTTGDEHPSSGASMTTMTMDLPPPPSLLLAGQRGGGISPSQQQQSQQHSASLSPTAAAGGSGGGRGSHGSSRHLSLVDHTSTALSRPSSPSGHASARPSSSLAAAAGSSSGGGAFNGSGLRLSGGATDDDYDGTVAVLQEAQDRAQQAVEATESREDDTVPSFLHQPAASPVGKRAQGHLAGSSSSALSSSTLAAGGSAGSSSISMTRGRTSRGDSTGVLAAVAPITVTATGHASASATALLSVPSSSSAAAPGGSATAASTSAGLSPHHTTHHHLPRGSRTELAPEPPAANGAPGNDDDADVAASARLTSNFGVSLCLTSDEMLQSDVKSDIVHTFTEGKRTAGSANSSSGSQQQAAGGGSGRNSSSSSFSVTSYWAMHFHALRELLCGPSRDFVESLAFAARWAASGGKSGARFERTADRRYVVKHVSRTEFDMFVEHIAPAYFEHMRACAAAGVASFLAKVLGAFKVVVTAPTPQGSGAAGPLLGAAAPAALRRTTSYIVVMEDLFHTARIPEGLKFDLKGKMRAQKRPAAAAVAASGSAAGAAPAGGSAASSSISSSSKLGLPPTPSLSSEHSMRQHSSTAGGDDRSNRSTPSSSIDSEGPSRSVAAELQAAAAAAAATAVNTSLPFVNADSEDAVTTPGVDGATTGTGARDVETDDDGKGQAASGAAAGGGGGLVLYDGDFLAYTGGHPLPLTDASKRLLEETLRRDTEFLCRVKVIDYSLLIGLDPASGRLTVGIIDYLRRFDLVKQLESRMKTVTQLVTNVDPTVVQPERYMSRLQRAVLDKYFIAAPDVAFTAGALAASATAPSSSASAQSASAT